MSAKAAEQVPGAGTGAGFTRRDVGFTPEINAAFSGYLALHMHRTNRAIQIHYPTQRVRFLLRDYAHLSRLNAAVYQVFTLKVIIDGCLKRVRAIRQEVIKGVEAETLPDQKRVELLTEATRLQDLQTEAVELLQRLETGQ